MGNTPNLQGVVIRSRDYSIPRDLEYQHIRHSSQFIPEGMWWHFLRVPSGRTQRLSSSASNYSLFSSISYIVLYMGNAGISWRQIIHPNQSIKLTALRGPFFRLQRDVVPWVQEDSNTSYDEVSDAPSTRRQSDYWVPHCCLRYQQEVLAVRKFAATLVYLHIVFAIGERLLQHGQGLLASRRTEYAVQPGTIEPVCYIKIWSPLQESLQENPSERMVPLSYGSSWPDVASTSWLRRRGLSSVGQHP